MGLRALTTWFNYLVKPNSQPLVTRATTTMKASPDTRDLILDAARAEFQKRGTAGTRTQDIADQAGVNKALLHYYFSTKDELATAVFHRAAGRLIPPVMSELASGNSLEAKVDRVVHLYLDLLQETPELPVYVLSEMHHHPERLNQLITSATGTDPVSLGARVLGVLGQQIEAAVASGNMRPIEPEQFLVNLISLCIFPFTARPMISMFVGGPDRFDSFIGERRENLADFFMGALRP